MQTTAFIRSLGPTLVVLAAGALGACATGDQKLSITQWEAIETRTVDAPPTRAFRAVAETLLDFGYIILVSDSAAGLLRAVRQSPPDYHEEAHAPLMGALWPSEVVVYVRDEPPGRSRVRVQFREKGERASGRERVSELTAAVDRRLLAAPANPADGRGR